MGTRKFVRTRNYIDEFKYEAQIYWFVIVSLILTATMAVSSAETSTTKGYKIDLLAPLLFDQKIATKNPPENDRADFFEANASQLSPTHSQGGI